MKKTMKAMVLALTFVVAALGIAGCGDAKKEASGGSTAITLNVSAAASMTDAMKEIAAKYEMTNKNVKLVYNFGASGALQQSIEQGAPADLFFSAAQKQMKNLQDKNLIVDDTKRDLLVNKVVLIVPKNSSLAMNKFEDIVGDNVKKIALGETKGVPVGAYSEEIFTSLGVWDAVKGKAVLGSDVRQVLSWVESGEVDCGVVYATDAAISDKVKVVAVAPENSHKPVIYPVAVLKSSKQQAAAKAFLDYLSGAEAKQIFEKYGFQVK